MTIREITEPDIEEVAKLEAMVFPDAWSESSLRGSLCQAYTLFLGAWEGNVLVGYVLSYTVAEDAEIARLAVHPSHRRKGVARRLLREMEKMGKGRGIARLLLEVRRGNTGAARFYEDYGFVKDGIRKNYYSHPSEDAVLMSCGIGRRFPEVTAVSTRKA